MVSQRIVRTLWLFATLALAAPAPVGAHPLGNFSISQYSGIQIERDAIALRYFIDMAEIPTFQELQSREIPADPADARVSRYLRETADGLRAGLTLEVDGKPLALIVRSAEVIFPPGAADLPTMKLAVSMTAPLARSRAVAETLRYRDGNFATRTGWKEVVAVGRSGSTVLESSVPEHDRSRELSDYPTDLLTVRRRFAKRTCASLVRRRRPSSRASRLIGRRPIRGRPIRRHRSVRRPHPMSLRQPMRRRSPCRP